MRDTMDRLFDEAFARPFSSALVDGHGEGAPALDVYQTDEEIVVKAGLPEVRAEDVLISVANGVLSIRGELREEKDEHKATFHRASVASARLPARSACPPTSTRTRRTPNSTASPL